MESLQITLRDELRERIKSFDLHLNSLAEQTFHIGEVIGKLLDYGYDLGKIADMLKESERFKPYNHASLIRLASKWSNSVFYLKSDYGDTFEDIKLSIKEKYDMEMTSGLMREYRGSMNQYIHGKKRIDGVSKMYKQMDSTEKAEHISALIEDFSQEHNNEENRNLSDDVRKQWRDVATEYVKQKAVPGVRSGPYVNFLKRLNCIHCDKPDCGNVAYMEVKTLPVVGETDLMNMPICVPCRKLYAKGKIFYTTEEKLMISFKYISLFFDAMVKNSREEDLSI